FAGREAHVQHLERVAVVDHHRVDVRALEDELPVDHVQPHGPDNGPARSGAATQAAMLPNLKLTEFVLGIGPAKPDMKLPKKRMYSDVVIVGKDRDWILTQWLSKDVIMEPVPSTVRNKQEQAKNRQSKRTISVNFARFGLPIRSFGAVFNTLNQNIGG
ncbi:hypothetical protein T310_8612, partial [Rasamsonia emersonii CBS 393.64]